ncbi:hypothetical protein FH972_013770 [Carpinus fangiana]|uniref:Exocyst subunit Exo70 family protein n=1 Tax=Carpinus fangiana TaxID=176857 RepID=A0A5N6RB97_9ROSI|nr:hypothetical protein FH972_013770 [Carpinus fangiana]
MRLHPDYLRTYTPEEIDEMEWESLETAISLWNQHLELALKTVLVSEKKLCNQVLGKIMDGLVWPECFVKIADKIMAVFFRFGEGVARSSKEPHKLFKLLDMFDSLQKLKPDFLETFDGEAGADICTRFRELTKLLVNSSTRQAKCFGEFGLQIEGNSDGFPPPQDGSVPKVVRYSINFFKNLAADNYRAPMAMVLRTEQIWKAGIFSKPETNEILLKDAISNVMDALQRNVESKRLRYKDKILPHIFSMNTYWYMYMRTRNTELGDLLGEQYMKTKYKVVAQESAYMYQNLAWGHLVGILDKEELKRLRSKELLRNMVREKMYDFLKGLDEISQRHRWSYSIPDLDLREQIKQSTMKFLVPPYSEFLNTYSAVLQGKLYVQPIEGLLAQIFEGDDMKLKRRYSKDRMGGGGNSLTLEREIRDFVGPYQIIAILSDWYIRCWV